MIYQLKLPKRSPFTSKVTEAFLRIYGDTFSLVSAEPGLDSDRPSVRIACELRPGAVFLNSPPVRLVATDGTRFEFEIRENELENLEDWLKGRKAEGCLGTW